MPYREHHYRWEWQFEASPEALWPYVADTNRFNRDTGLPAVTRAVQPVADLTNGRKQLQFHRLGILVEWEEAPFEWVRPSRFGVVRRYRRGPVAEMRVLVELIPLPGGGTRLIYQVWARPASPLGLLAIPIQIGWLSARAFDAAFRRYDRLAREQAPADADLPERAGAGTLAPGGEARLTEAVQTLTGQGADSALVCRLADWIRRADELAAVRLRPYVLADQWGNNRRAVLELCLRATRIGLLAFQWELLCPLCRGSAARYSTLREVRPDVHCESCNIDFSANFEHAVELTFRPTPAVRAITRQSFCVGGPQLTPHIVAQQLLAPHAARTIHITLEPGRYRARTLSLRGGHYLQVTPTGAPVAHIRADESGWPNDELRLAPQVTLTLENGTQQEQLLALERMAYNDDAATAADVFALQVFRDLFAEEALRPGDPISVGSMVVVFTDLRQSTQLYRTMGDAVAFGLVMEHFDLLRAAIDAESGAIVKLLGDSVMAVFRRPIAAVRAMSHAQQKLAALTGRPLPLRLRAGIHYGPCIAVTMNDRLDYFGSTINAAARLTDFSSGDDLILSGPVRWDPEVVSWLEDQGDLLELAPLTASLKGFEAELFELWRVSPNRIPTLPMR